MSEKKIIGLPTNGIRPLNKPESPKKSLLNELESVNKRIKELSIKGTSMFSDEKGNRIKLQTPFDCYCEQIKYVETLSEYDKNQCRLRGDGRYLREQEELDFLNEKKRQLEEKIMWEEKDEKIQ